MSQPFDGAMEGSVEALKISWVSVKLRWSSVPCCCGGKGTLANVWERKIMSCAQQLHLLELHPSCMCQTQGCALRVVILIAQLQNAEVNPQTYTGRMIPYNRSRGNVGLWEGSTLDMCSKVQRRAVKQVINSGYGRKKGKCHWMCNYEQHWTKFPFAQQQKCFHLFWVVSSWSICC